MAHSSNQPYVLPACFNLHMWRIKRQPCCLRQHINHHLKIDLELRFIYQELSFFKHGLCLRPYVWPGHIADPSSASSIMAESLAVLGAVAGSTQLAVQAAKSFIYLRDLVIKMKAAPEEVRRHTVHVEQLIALTELFKTTPELHATIKPTLSTCLEQAQDINRFLETIVIHDKEKWFGRTTKKFRVARKEKETNQMFERLEREKTSLIVAIAQVDK